MRTQFTALFLLVFLTPRIASSDASLNCDAYAFAAVAQQQQNVAQTCGFSGPAWSVDFNGHKDWCLAPSTMMANLTFEHNARAQALAQCGVQVPEGAAGDLKLNLQPKQLTPVDLLGLNPQPEPPKPVDLFGLNPQPEPPSMPLE
jgi:hypothetical protein